MAFRTLDATKRSPKVSVLLKTFGKRVVGQEAPIEAMVNLLERSESGIYDKARPIGALLFLGPTGTGKTGSVEAFVEGLFGHPSKMMKVDCGEFQHSHEIAKLVGSPPGYLGHRETHPFFTNASVLAARSNAEGKEIMPFTVVLWDEIEKASDSLWYLMLGILDKGTLTTGTNEKVDMTPTIHIMTSNVGAAELADDSVLGFTSGPKEVNDDKISAVAMAAARRKFAPEFLNRIDQVVCFKTLTMTQMGEVLALELEKVQDRIVLGSGVPLFEIRVSNAGLQELLTKGYDRRYNARHLKRAIEKNLAEPLMRLVTTQQIEDGDIIVCDYTPEGWRFMSVGNMKEKSNAAAAPSDIPSRISS